MTYLVGLSRPQRIFQWAMLELTPLTLNLKCRAGVFNLREGGQMKPCQVRARKPRGTNAIIPKISGRSYRYCLFFFFQRGYRLKEGGAATAGRDHYRASKQELTPMLL
jgi:hypothetical protein